MGQMKEPELTAELMALKRQLKNMTAWNGRLKKELRAARHALDVANTRVGESNSHKG